MDDYLFLEGLWVITPESEGEVVDVIGKTIVVKLNKGPTQTFPSDDIANNTIAG